MDVDQRLEALEAENERLRDEIEVLRESQGQGFLAPLQFNLTGMETKMLGRLLRGGLATKQGLMSVLYSDRGSVDVEIKIVDVYLCKLRGKLKKFDLTIETRWGLGYQMSPEMIAKYKQDWGQP